MYYINLFNACTLSDSPFFFPPPAPCPPTQLTVDSSCKSNNISVSWQASQGSVSYMAVAKNAEGRRWSCNTSSTACQISDLPCGQRYQVYVAGVDEKCMGAKSNVKEIRTGRYSNPGRIWLVCVLFTVKANSGSSD